MCFPGLGAIAGIGMSALQAGAQSEAAQQQYDQQVRQYQQNVTNSEAADRDNQVALNQREEQEAAASGQKIQQQSVQGAIKSSQLAASAGGSGISGSSLSVGNLLADVQRTVDENDGVLRTNARDTALQLQSQKVASVDQDQSRIDSVAIPVAPDETGAALGVAGAALKGFGSLTSSGTLGSGGSTGSNFFGM